MHVCGFCKWCLSFSGGCGSEMQAEVNNQMEENNMSVISMKQLLEAGVPVSYTHLTLPTT